MATDLRLQIQKLLTNNGLTCVEAELDGLISHSSIDLELQDIENDNSEEVIDDEIVPEEKESDRVVDKGNKKSRRMSVLWSRAQVAATETTTSSDVSNNDDSASETESIVSADDLSDDDLNSIIEDLVFNQLLFNLPLLAGFTGESRSARDKTKSRKRQSYQKQRLGKANDIA